MKSYVLDSYVVISYLENESGAAEIAKILTRASQKDIKIYFCIINWGEVYYITLRECGQRICDTVMSVINLLPLTIVDVDMELTKQAAIFKAKYKMSYSDCFAAALSKKVKATLVTGDSEFKQIEKEISIYWI